MRALLAASALCLLLAVSPVQAAPTRHYFGWLRVTQYVQCCTTASGTRVHYGECAADPSIPFGAVVVVPGLGRFRVEDRGSAVYGAHIDVWVPYYPYPGIRDWYRHAFWVK